MVKKVEICYDHGMLCEAGEEWQLAPSGLAPTDLFDNADFTVSTCPQCSSDEEPLDERFRSAQGMGFVHA